MLAMAAKSPEFYLSGPNKFMASKVRRDPEEACERPGGNTQHARRNLSLRGKTHLGTGHDGGNGFFGGEAGRVEQAEVHLHVL